MFTFNKTNYLPKNSLRTKFSVVQHNLLDEIQCFSLAISPSVSIATLFALIEKHIFLRNIPALQQMNQVCQKQINYLQSNKQDTSACEKFLLVINQIIKKLLEPQQNNSVLKDLHSRKENIAGYLSWLSQSLGQNCLRKLSVQYKIKIVVYELQKINQQSETSLIRLVQSIDQSKQINSLMEVKLIMLDNKYHILYFLNCQQMDNLLKTFKNYKNGSQKLKQIHDKNKTLEEKIKVLEEKYFSMSISKDKAIKQAKQQAQQSNKKISNLEAEKLKLTNSCKEIQKKLEIAQKLINQNKKQIDKLQTVKRQLEKKIKVQNRLHIDLLESTQMVNFNKFKIVQEEKQQRKTSVEPKSTSDEKTRDRGSKFKILESIKTPRHQTEVKLPPKPKKKVNILDFSLKESFRQDICEICEQVMVPFSIFQCNHMSCSNCLVRYIEACLNDGCLPVCTNETCGKQCDIQIAYSFLSFKQRKDLRQKLQQRIFRIKFKNAFFTCPQCHQEQIFDEELKFVQHCGKTFCRKCSNSHAGTAKCQEAGLLIILQALQFPTICPNCKALFDKDDKCDHVGCYYCLDPQKKKIDYCARCSCLRSPTLGHDGSYHRTDCKYYAANPQALKKQPKCSECQKIQGPDHCKRPEQTFSQFLQNNFSKDFSLKLFKKRQQYDQSRQK